MTRYNFRVIYDAEVQYEWDEGFLSSNDATAQATRVVREVLEHSPDCEGVMILVTDEKRNRIATVQAPELIA